MQVSLGDLRPIAERAAMDLGYAARVSDHQSVVKEIVKLPVIQQRLRDPAFFSVLLCGQRWLVDAPRHQELLRDEASRIVAVCGRGWGKSLTVSLKAVSQFLFRLPRVEVLITSSSQRQSMQLFEYLESHIVGSAVLRSLVKRRTRTTIRLGEPLGGKVEALPCSPNKLRGKHPDALLVDEASIVPAKMLSSELLMMLTKPNSRLIMLGTPFGFDHPFRKAFTNASYKVYHFPSYTSPLVSQENLKEWRQIMTEEEWRREVEAEWVEIENSYFPLSLIGECFFDAELRLDLSLESLSGENRTLASSKACYAGLDLAKERDYSALSVVCKDGGVLKHIFLHQFPLGTDYADVVAYVAKANEVFRFQRLFADVGGPGGYITEELQRLVPSTLGVFLTDVKKEEILSGMKLRMERKGLALVNYQPLISQMNEQQYEYRVPKSGRERVHLGFHHPAGHHDDMLWSLALAVEAARSQPAGVVIPL